jgi:hypothetical protein
MMLKIQHCLGHRLTHSGEIVSLKHRPRSTPLPETFFISVSGTNFCWILSKPHGLVLSEGLGKLIKFNYPSDLESATFLPASSASTTCYRVSIYIYIPLYIYIYTYLCAWIFVPVHSIRALSTNLRIKQEALERINGLLCSDTTRAA